MAPDYAAPDATGERVISGTDFYGGMAETMAGTASVLTGQMVRYSDGVTANYQEIEAVLESAVQYPELSVPLLTAAGIVAILDGGRRVKRAVDNPYVPEDGYNP